MPLLQHFNQAADRPKIEESIEMSKSKSELNIESNDYLELTDGSQAAS